MTRIGQDLICSGFIGIILLHIHKVEATLKTVLNYFVVCCGQAAKAAFSRDEEGVNPSHYCHVNITIVIY